MHPIRPLVKPSIGQQFFHAVSRDAQVRLIGAFAEDGPKSSLAAYYLYRQKHPDADMMQFVPGTGIPHEEKLEPIDVSTMTPETNTDQHLVEMEPVIQPPPNVTTCARHPKEHVFNRFTNDGKWPNGALIRRWRKRPMKKIRHLSHEEEGSDSLSSGFGSERSPGPSISEDTSDEYPSVEQWVVVSGSGSASPPPYEYMLPQAVPYGPPMPVQLNEVYPQPPIAYLPEPYPSAPFNYMPYQILPASMVNDSNCIYLPISYPQPPQFICNSNVNVFQHGFIPGPWNYPHPAPISYYG